MAGHMGYESHGNRVSHEVIYRFIYDSSRDRAQFRLLGGLPPHARRSMTYDQGREFTGHE